MNPAARRALPFLATFDRYLLREFMRFFLLAIVGFVSFVNLFDAFEKIDTFIDYRATGGNIALYYLYSTPYKAVLVCPVALLLAGFLALGFMTRFHEITVMKSSGVSLYRLLLPVYAVGLVVSAASFVTSDFIMPHAQTRAREIYQTEIRGRTLKNLGSRMNVTYIGAENRLYLIRRYDIPRRTMVDMTVQEFDGDRLRRRVDAGKAIYENGTWKLEDGIDRVFEPDGSERAMPFQELRLDLPETPEDFAKEEVRPEQMSFPSLRRYVERLRQSGTPVQRFETDMHLRIAFPLSNLVILLIGSSLAVQMRRGGVALGFGFSLTISFAYWCLLRAGQVLGHNGTLPPVLAAWLGNIVFVALGLWLLYRARK